MPELQDQGSSSTPIDVHVLAASSNVSALFPDQKVSIAKKEGRVYPINDENYDLNYNTILDGKDISVPSSSDNKESSSKPTPEKLVDIDVNETSSSKHTKSEKNGRLFAEVDNDETIQDPARWSVAEFVTWLMLNSYSATIIRAVQGNFFFIHYLKVY